MPSVIRRSALLALLCVVVCAGCNSSGNSSSSASAEPAKPAEEKRPSLPIPADSPLAKVKFDMGQKEVTDLIGQPTDIQAFTTGKAWIPFYYGGDTHRVIYHYKGMGRVTFSPNSRYTGDLRVLEIEYDPGESGYK